MSTSHFPVGFNTNSCARCNRFGLTSVRHTADQPCDLPDLHALRHIEKLECFDCGKPVLGCLKRLCAPAAGPPTSGGCMARSFSALLTLTIAQMRFATSSEGEPPMPTSVELAEQLELDPSSPLALLPLVCRLDPDLDLPAPLWLNLPPGSFTLFAPVTYPFRVSVAEAMESSCTWDELVEAHVEWAVERVCGHRHEPGTSKVEFAVKFHGFDKHEVLPATNLGGLDNDAVAVYIRTLPEAEGEWLTRVLSGETTKGWPSPTRRVQQTPRLTRARTMATPAPYASPAASPPTQPAAAPSSVGPEGQLAQSINALVAAVLQQGAQTQALLQQQALQTQQLVQALLERDGPRHPPHKRLPARPTGAEAVLQARSGVQQLITGKSPTHAFLDYLYRLDRMSLCSAKPAKSNRGIFDQNCLRIYSTKIPASFSTWSPPITLRLREEARSLIASAEFARELCRQVASTNLLLSQVYEGTGIQAPKAPVPKESEMLAFLNLLAVSGSLGRTAGTRYQPHDILHALSGTWHFVWGMAINPDTAPALKGNCWTIGETPYHAIEATKPYLGK